MDIPTPGSSFRVKSPVAVRVHRPRPMNVLVEVHTRTTAYAVKVIDNGVDPLLIGWTRAERIEEYPNYAAGWSWATVQTTTYPDGEVTMNIETLVAMGKELATEFIEEERLEAELREAEIVKRRDLARRADRMGLGSSYKESSHRSHTTGGRR